MTKIKICGLTKRCDIDFVNEGQPDYCGFVINVPKSKRTLSLKEVRLLRQRLDTSILPVGVFVNASVRVVADLLHDQTISLAQLHGTEDNDYIDRLKDLTDKPLIQAFSISAKEDIYRASKSHADYILLDHGTGGTGTAFDWSLTSDCMRPFFLAGGIHPETISDAIQIAHPWAIDISSGVETFGTKDNQKIRAAIAAVRRITI